jgi:hypothetical protein
MLLILALLTLVIALIVTLIGPAATPEPSAASLSALPSALLAVFGWS